MHRPYKGSSPDIYVMNRQSNESLSHIVCIVLLLGVCGIIFLECWWRSWCVLPWWRICCSSDLEVLEGGRMLSCFGSALSLLLPRLSKSRVILSFLKIVICLLPYCGIRSFFFWWNWGTAHFWFFFYLFFLFCWWLLVPPILCSLLLANKISSFIQKDAT